MRGCALGLMTLFVALLACKKHGKVDRPPPPAQAVQSAAPPGSASRAATKATASAPGAPRPRPLDQMFAGPLDPTVIMKDRVTDRYVGDLYTSVPEGWRANTEQYDGMVILASKDGAAHTFSLSCGSARLANVKFWVRGGFRQKAKIAWDKDDTPAKVGPGDVDMHVGTGKGTYAGKAVRCYYVRGHFVIVEGCVADDAPPARMHEMIQAMKSVSKTRRP